MGGVVGGVPDAGFRLAQGGGDLVLAGADGGDDTQSGDDDTPHGVVSLLNSDEALPAVCKRV